MTPRARKLIPLGLVALAIMAIAVNKPFGGRPMRFTDPEKSGFETGFNASRLAPEELKRYGGPAGVARYVATRDGVPKEMREVWCENFVRGFEAGVRFTAEHSGK